MKAIFDRESAQSPVLINSREELSALIDGVIELPGDKPVPAIVELAVTEDAYGFPHLYAGIGAESGFVHELWNPARATLGNRNATGTELFDFAANTQEIPAEQVVPLETVRRVLTAYFEHGGNIPADFADLHQLTADQI
ncbi:hypothetical protein ADL03_15395 [Nocardia sp. NRRL S-836]|nr:hypothetical protein ADL03_15395 [Nocardia sp. NRRL S-836]